MSICAVCRREARGHGWFDARFKVSDPRRERSRHRLCGRTCQDICHRRRGMIDPTANEQAAMAAGGDAAGAYLESLEKSDLATLSQPEWRQLIEIVVTGYCDTLRELGLPWNWRIGPASRPVSDETYVARAFTPVGVGLRPFSVGHVEQPWRRPRTPGDLTIRWKRRSRALVADSWGAVEALLAEELEAYEVEILDGATVKRTLATTTTSVTYTAAQQTADWGALLGPGDTLDVRILQLSALVGRGTPKSVTLQF